ncbi:pentapeptide repeat-containing protein [Streptomyces sp. enrichment culture]|uniref:pentapeptide repeat-containing protein n=1 Tax=Streptomyces sp. enrichment culture TaxID=1795815 RepID=UPI003F57A0BA
MASVLLCVGTWFSLNWFLGSPSKASPKPLDTAAQLELLKLVFAIVAGMGALVALITSYRRQRIDELAGERAERAQAHTEKIAEANIYDATERRVTELYSQAVEQLGHEKATVRLGGLYSLERLAQHNEEHRQVVVEVVCAYLRMPYCPPVGREATVGPEGQNTNTDAHQEGQVRRAAQDILASHLRPEPLGHRLKGRGREIANNPLHWPHVTLNLRGAVLVDADFSEYFLVEPSFNEARFVGQARFSGATFIGPAHFTHAEFKGYAAFDGVEFAGHLFSHDSVFEGVADFRGSAFRRQHYLARVNFKKEAWFTDAQFYAGVRLANPAFPEPMPTFACGVDLSGARVLNLEEAVMLPSGWRVKNVGGERMIINSDNHSPAGPRSNNRPAYPRLDQDPGPQWSN